MHPPTCPNTGHTKAPAAHRPALHAEAPRSVPYADVTGMPRCCSTRRSARDAPWAPNFCFSALSDSGGERAGCFVSQQTRSYRAARCAAQLLSQPAPRRQRARPGPRGSREQTTSGTAEPRTGPASALPQPRSDGGGCRRRGRERYCGAARPPPAARRGRCGGAAGRAGPAAPFAGGGRPLLAAGGSAAARTIGRPLAARGRGGLRRVSLLLSSWSFESFTNGSSLKREKVWEQRCTWRCPRFPLLLQSPVPVPHGSPPLLHLFQFRQIYAF